MKGESIRYLVVYRDGTQCVTRFKPCPSDMGDILLYTEL